MPLIMHHVPSCRVYIDDGLTGADSIEGAIDLCVQLQALFNNLLRREPELHDQQTFRTIAESDDYTKMECKAGPLPLDSCRLLYSRQLDKATLTSDIAKTFYVLGWFAPVIIKAKILLQRL